MQARLLEAARDLIALEALLLDRQQWDAWLALYTEDAEFRVPTWRDDDTLTEDPDRELSFMHLVGRDLLAERANRLTSGLSSAALPAPRTTHVLGRALPDPAASADSPVLHSTWMSQVYSQKDGSIRHYAGRYEHRLRLENDDWRIARKTVILANDLLVSQLDFHYI